MDALGLLEHALCNPKRLAPAAARPASVAKSHPALQWKGLVTQQWDWEFPRVRGGPLQGFYKGCKGIDTQGLGIRAEGLRVRGGPLQGFYTGCKGIDTQGLGIRAEGLGFPNRGSLLGVLVISIATLWGLYWDPSFLQTLTALNPKT